MCAFFQGFTFMWVLIHVNISVRTNVTLRAFPHEQPTLFFEASFPLADPEIAL